jgi:peptidoglycan/LPS O-acetylase OafA/YrhL
MPLLARTQEIQGIESMPTRNNYDLLRLILAVTVILSHSYILGSGSYQGEPFYVISRGHSTGGGLAVDTFFLISGILIASSWERCKNSFEYFKKRVRRIYPAFLGVSLVSLLVVLPLSSGTIKGDSFLEKLASSVFDVITLRGFSITGAFPANPRGGFNGSLWTIRYEFGCYICLAILGILGLYRRRRVLICQFIAVYIVGIFAEWHWPGTSGPEGSFHASSPAVQNFVHWCHFAPIYMAGMLAWIYRLRIRLDGRIALGCLALLCVASAIPAGLAVVYPFAGTYLVVFAVCRKPVLQWVTRHGDLSYGTYLYAFPVQQLVIQSFGGKVNPLVVFAIATPLTLSLAAGSWFVIERRFLHRKQLQTRKLPVEYGVKPKATPHFVS